MNINMEPLKGNTLGEKHRNYNETLKAQLLAQGQAELLKINYNENDIDNMMKIDIACNNRNVDYIIEVFKCDDMLYVTTAIKHSVWLITEPEYAHLMNSDYLQSHVFPSMTTKAITKLMLHIRRYLKDEKRAEQFFHYVSKNNTKMALKWLENCSLLFTEEMVAKYANIISPNILSRLCRKSISILRIYTNNIRDKTYIAFNKVMFLLKNNVDEFLDITESLPKKFVKPRFDSKHTQIILNHSFQRINNNFSDFHDRIDLPTFVTYLLKNNIDIKTFLITRGNRCWFNFDNLKPFLVVLDKESNVDLLKQLYEKENYDNSSDSSHDTDNSATDNTDSSQSSNEENKSTNTSSDKEWTESEALFHAIEPNNEEFSVVYRWFEFTPFEVAFAGLTRFIHDGTSADYRHFIFVVLLNNARKNVEFVRRVLKFYLDNRSHEPSTYTIRFVNGVLSQHDAFRFDEATWQNLNKLFLKCHGYNQSSSKIEKWLETIIIRSALLGLPLHEVDVRKFTLNILKDIKKKLKSNENEKLFHYLYTHSVQKLNNQETKTEAGIKSAISLLVTICNLIKIWGKEEAHHKLIIDNMIKLSNLNKQLTKGKMLFLYRSIKPYHRQLFEKSLFLHPCEGMCINALKHDSSLLDRYRTEVEALCCDDSVSLKTFFRKLRTYWPESMATEWRSTLNSQLQAFSGHKALIRNIYCLFPQPILLDFIKKYAPSDNKIQWSEDILIDVNLRKHIAKWMHLARPQLSVEVVLWYAKGDYLQFTQLLLNSIYCNLRSKDFNTYIKQLLNSPVSLKKHGIRLASKRMTIGKLLLTFPSIWKSTRNLSIRAHLFASAFKTMCNAEEVLVRDSWEVLKIMIDDLNYEENKYIYDTLGNVNDVPLSVIDEYYNKCYIFLKELPDKYYGVIDFNYFTQYAVDVMQYLEPSFVENTLLVSVNDIFLQKDQSLLNVLAAYLLYSQDEAIQMQKYKNLLQPLFDIYLPKWQVKEFEPNVINNLQEFLTCTANYLQQFLFRINITMPVKMLNEIFSFLESELCKEELYRVITRWKLSVAFMQLLNDKVMTKEPDHLQNWEEIRNSSIEKYSEICIKYLEEDIENNFPSINILFARELNQVCEDFDIEGVIFLNLLDYMLANKKIQVYMLVLNLLKHTNFHNDKTKYRVNDIKKQLYFFPSDELKTHYINQYGQTFDDCELEDNDKQISDSESSSDSDYSTSCSEESSSYIEEENVREPRTCIVL